MRKILLAVGLLILVLQLSSCDFKKQATGHEDDIYVMADSAEFEALKPALDSTFEKIIFTPQPEKLFTLYRISERDLDQYRYKKNIIIIAPITSSSNTGKFIQATVDSALKNKIMEDSVFEITKYSLWAQNQLVMLLTAPTMGRLIKDIDKSRDNLLYAFQKISDQRLYASLYNPTFEQKNIEGMFLKKYGWIIYMQADYQVAIQDSAEHFVWLRRGANTDMERWIFIHWINNASPKYLNADSIRTIRNRLTKQFYRTSDDTSYVVIASDYYTTNEVNFEGRYALLTQGLWELNIKGMGGPFINYTFYDEKTHRIYMLDGSIYAPRYYKRNLIQQMDVTLQSFKTASEISKEKKKELLDAAK